mmetsp:Transcript_11845/g.28103  ORF Transcript_11845/g.28103 Transcript_11845/m.28103 type:complete len:216 (+) Transcript_11845:290-937(+)
MTVCGRPASRRSRSHTRTSLHLGREGASGKGLAPCGSRRRRHKASATWLTIPCARSLRTRAVSCAFCASCGRWSCWSGSGAPPGTAGTLPSSGSRGRLRLAARSLPMRRARSPISLAGAQRRTTNSSPKSTLPSAGALGICSTGSSPYTVPPGSGPMRCYLRTISGSRRRSSTRSSERSRHRSSTLSPRSRRTTSALRRSSRSSRLRGRSRLSLS